MQASKKISLTTLLSSLVIAVVLAAPCAFAKKDLFANDPASKQAPVADQLVATSTPAAEETQNTQHASSEVAAPASTPEPAVESKKKTSYVESQLVRLKGNLIEAKEDLFGSKKSSQKIAPLAQQQPEQALTENTQTLEEALPETPELPTISPTEAAQRAQTFAEGQLINVRKYHEEDKPRYAVKLLQKNGRMKTINLDAVSGALIEETSQ